VAAFLRCVDQVHGLDTLRSAQLVLAIDLMGVFLGALNGAFVACKKNDFDLVGVVSLAVAGGLGGGLMRDVLREEGPPLALRNNWYLLAVACGATIGFLFGRRLVSHMQAPRRAFDRIIRVVDALALGNFAVSSTLLALHAGLSYSACFFVGVIGATGGGVLRDLLSHDRVALFVRGELHATAAGAASLTLLLALHPFHASPPLAATLGWLVGFGVRVLAVTYRWRAPLPPDLPLHR
jgi:uncharacterized membrane protein YeiH